MLRVMTGGAAASPTAGRPVHQRVYDALKQWTVGRSLNSVYDDGLPVLQEQVRELFAAEDFERLRRVKTRHDPHNLFRFTHNTTSSSCAPSRATTSIWWVTKPTWSGTSPPACATARSPKEVEHHCRA